MATVRDLVKAIPYCVQANEDVYCAACSMTKRNIGAVPVLRGTKLVGILSERDIMNRVVVQNLDPRTTTVSDVMTPDPCTVDANESIERCMLLMKQNNFRHLPVLDNGELVGIVAMRDLLLHDLDEKEVEVRMMRLYMASGTE